MPEIELIKIPELEDFAVEERIPAVQLLLEICKKQQQQIIQLNERLQIQSEQIAKQSEEIQHLKNEIDILKGGKGRPNIKPSSLSQNNQDINKNDKRGKPINKKTYKLKIHKEEILQPDNIPAGSEFKGFEEYIVQDIEISLKNTRYKRARYKTPDGKNIIADLPESVEGSHFGSKLKSYIISQYYQQHVTQNLILKQLWDFGIVISEGQLNRIITEQHEDFHAEKNDILKAGLEASGYVGVDDTSARHKGQNGFCTRIGNEFFTWFSSTESKSRLNFLQILSAPDTEYVIDNIARQYMAGNKLPKAQAKLFSKDSSFSDSAAWDSYLKQLNVISVRHRRIATEAALLAGITKSGISSKLAILSDDAGQFAVTGLLHALCWIHAERNINKIIPYADNNRQAQNDVLDQIWSYYQKLKNYKLKPSKAQKKLLSLEFDKIFNQKTCFHTLNLALNQIYKNKKELLLVLDRPDIPLHNNLSENDIRDYVKKRKISATTRSETGQAARDTFLSIKKTCQKLKISFWDYLIDRFTRANNIPPLGKVIILSASAP